MDWHEYLHQATQEIDDPKEAAAVRSELWTHLAFLTDELKHEGWDEEGARNEALRRMGAASEVSARFGAIHSKSRLHRVMALYEDELLRESKGLTVRGLLRVEWKRAIGRWQTWLAFSLLFAFCIQGLYTYYSSFAPVLTWAISHPEKYNAYLAFLHIFNGSTDFIVGVLPLLVVVAAGDSLAWDRKTGFVKYVVSRTTHTKYIAAKIGIASMLSFVVVLAAELSALGIAFCVFPLPSTNTVIADIAPKLMSTIYAAHPLLYCLTIAVVTALAGMACSLMGVLLSTLIKNVYLVVAGPWLLFLIVSVPLLMFSPPYAPLYMIGPFINTQIGYGAGPGYAVVVPATWFAVWLVGGFLTYLIFTHKTKHREMD